MVTRSHLPPESDLDRPQPFRVGFLLVDDFTLTALSSAIEPLRMINWLSGRDYYCWQLLTPDGGPARSSDGIELVAHAGTRGFPAFDMVIVAAGLNVQQHDLTGQTRWLRSLARRPVLLGAVCTGSYVLAEGGLLDGYAASAHWDCLPALQQRYPGVGWNQHLYTFDRDRLTASGGTVPMHMMLSFLAMRHREELARAVSQMLVVDRVRTDDEPQRLPLQRHLHASRPKLAEVAQLMEANIEEPIGLEELAGYVGISRRQMERLFLTHLGCSPSRYYLKVRLERAQQLLKQTSCPIVEIANMCGFVSAAHFSRCYRKYLGRAPMADRSSMRSVAGVGWPRSEAPFGAAALEA